MAETFLFNITESVLSKLASLAADHISPALNIKSEVRRLHSTLSAIKAVILDAEEQQFTNHGVRDWLDKLKDAVSDIDDFLDDLTARNMEIGNKVITFFSSSNSVVVRFKNGRRIRGLRQKLDEIAADRSKFSFSERTHLISNDDNFREQTHSYVRASDIVGRDSDRENIVQMLLSSKNDDDNVSVIPIVGIGGLGKTTVVKLAYNDERVVERFDLRMWVSSISEDFSVGKVVEKILRSATGESFGHLDIDQMQRRLSEVLDGTRYLLVLDDVWNKDRIKWMDLRELLMKCSSGSKIVVTTRSKAVAVVTSTSEAYYDLTGLSDDDCLSLFLKCAFREPGDWLPNLVEIGREIVRKCGGIPLAVKTLGSLLYMNRDEGEWLRIKNNDIWEIDQKQSDILPILRLSYEQLPPHLRQCFAYCSMLPKGVQIPREEFINLWIAQGLVHSDNQDVGNRYFNELLSRFCFQEVVEAFDGEILACKIHNLVHDLAQSVAGAEYLKKLDGKKAVSDRVRHVFLEDEEQSGKEEPRALLRLRNVRSFRCAFKAKPLEKAFIHAIATSFRRLRVLILISLQLEELPSSIGNLKRLRYLDLSQSRNLKSLPTTLCKLVNLQTLNLINCENLKDLPKNLRRSINIRTMYLTCQNVSLGKSIHNNNFISLQFLLLYNCDFVQLPPGLENLTSLRVLRIYDCERLTTLPHSIKNLVSLQKLWVWNCQELDFGEGESVEGLTGLESLLMMGLPKLIDLPVKLTKNVAKTLKFLRIANCAKFTAVPEWILSFTLLQRIYVEDCPNLVKIPHLIHSHNAKLHISSCPNIVV